MEPYKAKTLPIEYVTDRDLLRLISEANQKYGEYKSMLKTLRFDASYFLNSIILTDSLKSTQIEGTQVSQDEMYYIKYLPTNDDNKEIENLKDTIEYAKQQLVLGRRIDLDLVNQMHAIILDSVRGANRDPGKPRTTQNWIGPRGCTIETATFVPPVATEVPRLLQNLFDYMNDTFVDPYLVNVALAHAQFETIHAYKDGNGRLGRALIPIQMSYLDESEPILFLSEILELYKPAYQRNLMEMRKGNIAGFLKFFMQCVIDQCNSYMFKINRINEVFEEDMETIKTIKGNSVYIVMPIILKNIVFTKKEIIDEAGIAESTVARVLNQLVEKNIIQHDNTVMKKGYRYGRVYDIFVQ